MVKLRRVGGRIFCFAMLAAVLAGCAGSADDTVGRLVVSPDKYEFYSCAQLTQALAVAQTREKELERLTAKAETGAGGAFASAIAYRPEYVEVHGETNQLHRTMADKKCNAAPETANPQANPQAKPGAPGSSQAIH